MNILVLGGGISPEHDVSVRSSGAVKDALIKLQHNVTYLDPAKTSTDEIITTARQVDVIFPILHGIGGEDGVLQQLFDDNGLSYLGCGPKACRNTYDKIRFKEILLENNLPTPKYAVVSKDTFLTHDLTKKPFVLKPIGGGSSIDTSIVREKDCDTAPLLEALERYSGMLLEELIEGTEITVGVLGDTALPVIEIIPPSGGEFDYKNKYNGATAEMCPPENVSESIQKEAQKLAEQIHSVMGCQHISRTDFMINSDGELFALDCNTIPGLTDQSLFPKAAKQAGMSWEELVETFVTLSSAKQKNTT